MRRGVSALAVVAAALLGSASPAWAADDSFEVWSLDRCGSGQFVDDESSGLRDGNDHVVIYDHCADGFNVYASVWSGLSFLGAEYNRGGPGGPPVVWDPFTDEGGTHNGDHIELVICLSEPDDDGAWSQCDYQDVYIDG